MKSHGDVSACLCSSHCEMACRYDPSSRLPPDMVVSKRSSVVLAMALNTSALKTPADIAKQIPLNIIDAYTQIPARESSNFWEWEQTGERKLAIPFETDKEMKEIAKKLHNCSLAHRKYYLNGKCCRLSMVTIFGREEDIERAIGRWGSKWDIMESNSESSDGEDDGCESDSEDYRRNAGAYDMIFVFNLSLGLPHLTWAEMMATAALGLYRKVNEDDMGPNKHYVKWADREKLDEAYAALNNTLMHVLCKQSLLHDVMAFKTSGSQNGREKISIIGLFGQKIILKSLLRHMTKL